MKAQTVLWVVGGLATVAVVGTLYARYSMAQELPGEPGKKELGPGEKLLAAMRGTGIDLSPILSDDRVAGDVKNAAKLGGGAFGEFTDAFLGSLAGA